MGGGRGEQATDGRTDGRNKEILRQKLADKLLASQACNRVTRMPNVNWLLNALKMAATISSLPICLTMGQNQNISCLKRTSNSSIASKSINFSLDVQIIPNVINQLPS